MKPRTLKTYKILAVALTAASGCAPTSGAAPETARAEVVPVVIVPVTAGNAAEAPKPLMAMPAEAPQTNASAEAPAPAAAPRPEPTSKDPALLALRNQLARIAMDDLVGQTAHFRPLCDKDGYPVVGNLYRKTPTQTQPSAFCEGIRTGQLR